MSELPKKLLIVDEENPFHEELVSLLRDENISVKTSSSPREALDILKREKIDFLMVATLSPHHETIELLRQLQLGELTTQPPMILMSSYYQSPSFSQEIDRMKRARYLVRPFQKRELLETIQELFSSHMVH